MDVRKLTDSRDWLESERVLATAFLHPWDEDEMRGRTQAQAEGSAPRPEESWGLFDDGGTMLTSISTLRRTLSFGGKALPAGEVHMVGSLPERRGGGGVRTLMREILSDFRNRGDALAVLIPFSCAFYRKFGFEVASRMLRQRLAVDQLAGFTCEMRVTRVWIENDLSPVRALCDSFALAHDLCELRGEGAWAWHCSGDFGEPDFLHPERPRYAYVLWDEGDKPRAYVRFSFFHKPDFPFVGELDVFDLAYDSPEALRAVLGFLYRMRAKVSHVNLSLADVDLATLVPEGDKVEQEVDSHVMARMLDVGQLLRQMPQPYGEGSYVLGVDDAFMPEVAGCWQVTYTDGHTTAVERTDLAPDLRADETVACQLVLGRVGLADALLRPVVTVTGNAETLARAFVQRPTHLAL
ncbi:MAG: GNAT family N-acetyltransferase [Atopobiaceae bacterium]|nr:GNAT family N-acetyltransferase [Atopobiaceae bacterium]